VGVSRKTAQISILVSALPVGDVFPVIGGIAVIEAVDLNLIDDLIGPAPCVRVVAA
jgi:hypothetical protein